MNKATKEILKYKESMFNLSMGDGRWAKKEEDKLMLILSATKYLKGLSPEDVIELAKNSTNSNSKIIDTPSWDNLNDLERYFKINDVLVTIEELTNSLGVKTLLIKIK